ncbi:hypothetical protein Gasu2_33660 [Galdieria sulphuraria]|nr:hypothetical protein Gasu2_33660 [Galdieria sulphuraria]
MHQEQLALFFRDVLTKDSILRRKDKFLKIDKDRVSLFTTNWPSSFELKLCRAALKREKNKASDMEVVDYLSRKPQGRVDLPELSDEELKKLEKDSSRQEYSVFLLILAVLAVGGPMLYPPSINADLCVFFFKVMEPRTMAATARTKPTPPLTYSSVENSLNPLEADLANEAPLVEEDVVDKMFESPPPMNPSISVMMAKMSAMTAKTMVAMAIPPSFPLRNSPVAPRIKNTRAPKSSITFISF